MDYLPLAEFKAKQISLANVSGIHAEPISEMVLAYILSFARGIEASHAARREHNWIGDQIRNQIYTLTNRTVVILGLDILARGLLKSSKPSGSRRSALVAMAVSLLILTGLWLTNPVQLKPPRRTLWSTLCRWPLRPGTSLIRHSLTRWKISRSLLTSVVVPRWIPRRWLTHWIPINWLVPHWTSLKWAAWGNVAVMGDG